MKSLEKKVLNMTYGKQFQYVVCSIRWNDTKEIEHDMIFQVGGDPEEENADDKVFFYCEDINELITLCHNIDIEVDDFDDWNDYTEELDKYDGEEYFFPQGEDFAIVDIACVY